MHFNGSADADFVTLTGVSGSRHINTYILPGYPYENTTPQLLARCGFATYSFHGNGGDFYSRRAAFEKMGFAEVFFREELEGKHGLKGEYWGVSDRDVLSFAAQKLRTASEPTCHFVITLTTHTPYTLMSPREREIFMNPSTTVEHYINNMRYLDNCLRDYITALGRGTTVVLYADHAMERGDQRFQPDKAGQGIEHIPCFIYDTDEDLSKRQKTRNQPIAKNGDLNLVDVINYVRGQVEKSHASGAPAANSQPSP
jgi:phosphoglycerol transferase MdoB-like AlkP superfamily enzyme